MQRATIRFLRSGHVVEITAARATDTLLGWLRETRRETGTKEGCNEGDCGACTVALGALEEGRLVYRPVNACIALMVHLDGKELVTVEDLAADGTLHPVQQALVDAHGSQCGFCTPGFVMSLFTLYHQSAAPDRAGAAGWLAGNLCRCTGYRPILDAAMSACAGRAADAFERRRGATEAALAALDDGADIRIEAEGGLIAAPASLASLDALLAAYPQATLVAGATDVGLWITKQLRPLTHLIHLHRIRELRDLRDTPEALHIGAGVTYARAFDALARLHPDLGALLDRLGSQQVRASGTIGGNIANGSPIGDSPPALIALGATLELHGPQGPRHMALEDFFIAYGKQDRTAGEIVASVSVPKLKSHQRFRCYKISKRFDQDISALCGAFRFDLDDAGHIRTARIAFGGMAATPKRALAAEAALAGAALADPASWADAIAALAADYAPISDMRASAGYRRETAANLLRKALMEEAGAATAGTRILTARSLAHG